jgi:hypothetical protein
MQKTNPESMKIKTLFVKLTRASHFQIRLIPNNVIDRLKPGNRQHRFDKIRLGREISWEKGSGIRGSLDKLG